MSPSPRRRRPRRARRGLALTAAALAALAAAPVAALAAPPPSALTASTGPVTGAAEATFTWSASPPEAGGSVRYEGGLGDELTDFGTATSAIRALPEGRQTFRVRAVELDPVTGLEFASAFSTVEITVDRTPPTIAGTFGPALNRFGWSARPVTVTFACADPGGSGVASCTPPVELREGAGQSAAGVVRDRVGLEASATVSGINVDLTPPTAAALGGPGAGAIVRERRPTFTWAPAGDALSGVGGYQLFVNNPRGTGSAPFVTGTSFTWPSDLAVGRHTWFVRALDFAQNRADSPVREFVIDPSTPVAGPGGGTGGGGTGGGAAAGSPGAAPEPEETTTGGRTVLRPPAENARRLTPRAGVRLRTPRPALRWTGVPRGTTLSNVQLFRMRGRALVKVHSAFPRKRAYRVPAGLLKPGGTYVWRVWPFRGARGFTAKPLGVSWFRLRPLADLLPAAARARITSPTRARRGERLVVSWRARPGVRRYKVTLARSGQQLVFSGLARGSRVTIPAAALRRAGTYALIVRAARAGSLRRFHPAPWAAAALRVR